jgi:hypothetical protein
MNNERTISTVEVDSTDAQLLTGYRQYIGNSSATADDLYRFLTTPSPDRDVFYSVYCAPSISTVDNIVLSTYAPLP